MSLLLRFVIYLVVFAIVWAIISYIPLPPGFGWIGPVVMLLALLIVVLGEAGYVSGWPRNPP